MCVYFFLHLSFFPFRFPLFFVFVFKRSLSRFAALLVAFIAAAAVVTSTIP